MINKISIVHLYKTRFDENKSLIELFKSENQELSFYSFYKAPKKYFHTKLELLLQEIVCFFKLQFSFFKFYKKSILCLGGHLSFLLTNRIFAGLCPDSYHLYIYNFYLHALGEKKIVQWMLRFLLNSSRITLIVQSPYEVNYYSKLTKKCNIHFVPFYGNISYKITPFHFENAVPYIFTGGYTNRDYLTMISCAKAFPLMQFVFVVSSLNMDDFKNEIPENVILYKDVTREVFYGMLENAAAVIVPLKENVGSSGQMLCLGAMELAKVIIYTDISSINYYFKNGEYGIPYKIGDVDSLKAAVELFMNSKKEDMDQMATNAYNYYKDNYTKEKGDKLLSKILI